MAKPKPKPKKKVTLDSLFSQQGADATRAPRVQPVAPRTMSASLPSGMSGRLHLPRKVLPSDQPHPTDIPANLGQLGDKAAIAASMVPGGQLPAGAYMMARGAASGHPAEGVMGGLIAMSHVPGAGSVGERVAPMLSELGRGVDRFARGGALPKIEQWSQPRAAEMARTFEGLPKVDPLAEHGYRQMVDDVQRQYAQMQKDGIKVEFTASDPYKSSKAMMADIRDNKTLKVFKTPGDHGHPFLSAEENDMFRAVHDYYGHAKTGNPFSALGEENAYRAHSPMFAGDGRRAMAAETRGQNSWFNAGPHAGTPAPERPFAEQKGALWPEELMGEYKAAPVARERRGVRRRLAEIIDPSVKADRRALVTDEMTGLGNRRAFEQARAGIDADPNMSWVVLDAQRLKAVNTQYGQIGGDALLRRSGDSIHEALKGIPGARGFHVSGDEFAIAVPKGMEQMVMERAGSARIPVHADGRLGSAGLVGHIGDTYAAADKGLQGAKAAAKASEPVTPALDYLKSVATERPAAPVRLPTAGRPGGTQLMTPSASEAGGLPAVPQLPVTRKQPLTAKSSRETSDLLDRVYRNFMKAEKEGAIERGVAAGAPEWWRADATRQRFIDQLGPVKGEAAFQEWAKTFAGTSAMSDASSNMARSMFLFPQLEHPSGHALNVFRAEGLNPFLPEGIGTVAGQTQGKVVADLIDPAVTNPWQRGGRAKMESMYENTVGNWRPSTHDRHMGRTGYDDMGFPSSIGGNQYDPFETATNLRANELMKRGDLPVAPGKAPDAPYQASMWVGNGEKTGVKSDPRNVDQLFADQAAEYARAHGISEPDFMRRFAQRDPMLFGGMDKLTTVRADPAHKVQSRLPGF